MAYTKKLFEATARGALVLSLVVTLGVIALGNAGAVASSEKAPVATSVRAITSGDATLITIYGTAPMAVAASIAPVARS